MKNDSDSHKTLCENVAYMARRDNETRPGWEDPNPFTSWVHYADFTESELRRELKILSAKVAERTTF